MRARCGLSVHRDVAFLGIFVLKILTTISELVYLGGILMEVMALEILCFTTTSLRESLTQEQLCTPQKPLEIVHWHFIIVPRCTGWDGTGFETNSQGSFYFL